MKNFNRNCFFTIALCVLTSTVWTDSLELKSGSLINGKFIGGTEGDVSFQVGSSVQKFNVADLVSIKFGESPAAAASARQLIPRPASSMSSVQTNVTVPAGTRILVRTIDATKNRAGNRFQASLQEPFTVDGVVVAPKGADIYGRLAESKQASRLAGDRNCNWS